MPLPNPIPSELIPESRTNKKRKREGRKEEAEGKRKEVMTVSEAKEMLLADKKISIYFSTGYDECRKWFALNPSCINSDKPLFPVASFPFKVAPVSAVIGSDIYVFGGHDGPNLGTTDAFVYHIGVSDKWQQLQPMITPRIAPTVVVYDKTIFVLGCSMTRPSDLKCWGEAYHTDTKSWSPVPMLPDLYYFRLNSCVAVPYKKSIIVSIGHQFFRFRYDKWRWSKKPMRIPPYPKRLWRDIVSPDMVAVRNQLFMFYGLEMYVYEFDRPQSGLQRVYGCLQRHIPFPSEMATSITMRYQFYLGKGIFCIVFSPNTNKFDRQIHCVKVQVHKIKDYRGECVRSATVLGYEVGSVDHCNRVLCSYEFIKRS